MFRSLKRPVTAFIGVATFLLAVEAAAENSCDAIHAKISSGEAFPEISVDVEKGEVTIRLGSKTCVETLDTFLAREQGTQPPPKKKSNKAAPEKPEKKAAKPKAPPKAEKPRCRYKIRSLWSESTHVIDGYEYWLGAAYTIDFDKDGLAEDLGFTLKSHNRRDIMLRYNSALDGPPAKSMASLNPSELVSPEHVCLGRATFPDRAQKPLKPKKPKPQPAQAERNEPATGTKKDTKAPCSHRVESLWSASTHKIDGYEYWLSAAYTIDFDKNGVVEDLGFILKSHDRPDMMLRYGRALEGRVAAKSIPTLKPKKHITPEQICFGRVAFPDRPREDSSRPATTLWESPDLETEFKTNEAMEAMPEQEPIEPQINVKSNGDDMWMWIIGGGLLAVTLIGLVVVVFMVRGGGSGEDSDEESDEGDEDEDE